jgi:tetratricopeptide (TPR) repeat protein
LNEREIVRKLFSDGVASYHDFESYGNLQSLEQAISKFEAIIDMTPEMHPRLPTILCNLGAFLLSRFEELGEVIDMNDAIQRLETAVGLIPDGHPDKPSYLTNLGNALDSRFERFGDVDDINGAIVRKQTVVNLTPDGHPDKPSYLGNLGNSLWIRFRRLGNKDDINDAVTHHQAAINLTPDGHPDQPSNLSNLGNSLQTRFEWLGNLSDIDGSIAQQQAAVNLTPDGHPSKPSRLSNLGTCLQTRFERLGNVADINSAITHQQKAVNLTPERHPDMPLHLTSLGNSLQARFQRLGHVVDIDKAITHQQVAVKLTPDDHPNKSGRLNNLGTSLQTRFERFRRLEDLDNAIVEEQAAVLLTPDGHPNKPMYLTNLGNSLQTRFEILENVDDIDGSISQHQAAVELIPDGHPSKPGYLGNLGEGLRVRFLHLNDLQDAKLAIFYLSASAQSSVGSPTIRFKTAQRWISIASIIEHESLLIAYDCAINLMPLVAWLGLPISDRHEHLVQIGGIARDAAATAISMKKHDKALEWLEQGRSIVWNQVLQLRTPVDELRRVDSDLADRLVQISRLLDPGFERKGGLDFIEEEAQRYRALTNEWELIIEQVRSLPTFEDFLKPPRFSRLKNAARNGPVIVLNITEERCDALALVAGVEVTHIPLPNITSKKVNELRDELKDILYSNGLRLRGDRAAQKWTDESDSNDCWDILAELWNGVAKPVLDSLELSVRFILPFESNLLTMIWSASVKYAPAYLVVSNWTTCFSPDTYSRNIQLRLEEFANY